MTAPDSRAAAGRDAPAAAQPRARSFVFLAGTGFDSVVSGRARHLAQGLAGRGYAVSFVELPSLRVGLAPPYHCGPRRERPGGVRVIRPRPFPGYVRLHAGRLARRWEARVARRLLEWIPDLAESVLVVPTPRWVPVVERLPRALLCYDYIDHVEVQAGPRGGAVFAQWDARLLAKSDLVLAVAEPLQRRLFERVDPARVSLVANGVPGEWIGAAVEGLSRASLVARPERPIAGFLGSLFEWIDVEALAAIARRLPEVEFVLVGPTRRGVSLQALQEFPNLHLRGALPFAQVPATIAAFDVCLIPFRRDAIAEYADPLKVYEYCALGKPVVSSVAYGTTENPAPIRVAGDDAAFARAIEAYCGEDDPAARAERVAYAAQHTWERRVDQLLEAVQRAQRGVSPE